MNFISLVEKRRSVRQYSDQIITHEQLQQIAEAGRLAPSAVNYQPWLFYIVTSDEYLNGLYESYNREWFCKCRYAIVVCADHSKAWIRQSDQKSFAAIDAAIAIDHMTLQAASMNIGSCWICNFNPEILRRNLQTPADLEPIAIIALGFPNDSSVWEQPKKRNEIQEIIEWK